MANPTPYRSLAPARRLALVTKAMTAHRDVRAGFVQRLVSRGGGFRAATLMSWPVDRLAREIVRMNAESNQDELDLLHLLYVEFEPAIQITFLDAAGVKHANGVIEESLEPPFATEAAVKRAADAVRAAHGEDGAHYLFTIATYNLASWPGLTPSA
ncbi:MAG: hypothetical protein NTZ43_00550 [Gemmatimonadetes bacterium]|nr:hypothetical protein [Gemmatimonadota bacterium]